MHELPIESTFEAYLQTLRDELMGPGAATADLGSGGSVTVSVAPDAQTVLATVTTLSTDAHFQYTVDDGHGHSSPAR